MAVGVAQGFAAAISRAQGRKVESVLEVRDQGEGEVGGVEDMVDMVVTVRAGFNDGLEGIGGWVQDRRSARVVMKFVAAGADGRFGREVCGRGR